MKSIREVINDHVVGGKLNTRELAEALVAREDNIADILRLAGVQFGLYPEIVAKVLTDAGLGTPPTDEARQHIHEQFVGRMEWLRQQNGN